MVDLNSAYQDAKFMSDDQLKQELAAPTGMIPGYIIMSELQDRAGIRAGTQPTDQPSMKDQMLASSRQYSRGGMIAQLNPLDTMDKVMRNPDLLPGYMQDAMNNSSGGLPTLQPASAPGPAQTPYTISSLVPTPSGSPQQPIKYAQGGLAALLRR